jgi:hypothetical protein
MRVVCDDAQRVCGGGGLCFCYTLYVIQLYAQGGPGGSPCAPLPRVLAVHLALGYAQCLTLSSIR